MDWWWHLYTPCAKPPRQFFFFHFSVPTAPFLVVHTVPQEDSKSQWEGEDEDDPRVKERVDTLGGSHTSQVCGLALLPSPKEDAFAAPVGPRPSPFANT